MTLKHGHDEQTRRLGRVIARCWADENYMEKVLACPYEILTLEGVDLPPDQVVKAVRNTDSQFHLVIPVRPKGVSDELLLQELDKYWDGYWIWCQPLSEKDCRAAFSNIILRCWQDEVFKKAFIADPKSILQADNVVLPTRLAVVGLENTGGSGSNYYLIIPEKPIDILEMSEEALESSTEQMKCWDNNCGWQCHLCIA